MLILSSGFHVQPDGLVTGVEGGGCAARAGMRRGARLLEVCRAAVVALHHDQLVDLLKTSDPVTVRETYYCNFYVTLEMANEVRNAAFVTIVWRSQ